MANHLWREAGFVLSLVCCIFDCITITFNVYAVPLKEILNFTQTEVELVASANTAGLGMTIPAALLLPIIGYKKMYAVHFLTIVPGFLLLWLSVVYVDFFSHWPSLVCLFQFITSSGNEMALYTYLSIATDNFGEKNVGKLTGLYLAANGLGKIVHGFLYQYCFQKNHNLHLFFFTLLIINSILLPICFAVHQPYVSEERLEEIPLTGPRSRQHVADAIQETGNNESVPHNTLPVTQIFKSVYFPLMFWPSALFFSCSFTFMNNVTTLAESVNLDQPLNLVYVLTVPIVAGRILFGVIYDHYRSVACGFCLLFVCYVCFISAMVIGSFNLNYVTVYVMTICCGLGNAGGLLLPVIMLSAEFGVQHLTIISGFFLVLVAMLTVIMQAIVGILYDDVQFQQNSGDIFCRGNICFLWTFILLLCITVVVTICEAVNFIYNICFRQV